MPIIHETAYPRLKPNLTDKELEENFAPNVEELQLMQNNTKSSSEMSQLGFMITLKCYQCLGRPINLDKVPKSIKNYITGCINIINPTKLHDYKKSSTRKRHIKVIRNYLQINDDRAARRKCVKKVALNSASSKENLADIINDVIEELIKSCFELPGFHILQRLARAARKLVNNQYYNHITGLLSEEAKMFINDLFDVEKANSPSTQWATLKQEPKSPTPKRVKEFFVHLLELKLLRKRVNIDMGTIPAKRFEQFVDEAMSLDSADMRKLKENRRYCLATVLIHYKAASSMDDIVIILIRWIRKLHTKGSQNLNNYKLKHTPETDDLVSLLHKILLVLKSDEETHIERISAIENCIVQGTDEAIEQCEQYMAYSGDNYYPFMLKLYSNKRYLIFQLLDQLDIKSSSNDTYIEEAIHFVKLHRNSRKEWLDINYVNRQGHRDILDLSWLPEKWFKTVTNKTKGSRVSKINRKYYELAIITSLAEDLNSSDAYIEGAYIYDDPNKQFIPWKQFYEEVDEYCDMIKIPNNGKNFVTKLQDQLQNTACKVDNSYINNEYLHIEKGEPIIKKHPAKNKPDNLDKISNLIANRMPLTNIVDIIMDTEKWLNISMHFKPISGYETKIQDYKLRFVATSFSYGCNVGPSQGERCLQKYTRKQIAWIFNHHVTETKLDKAITKTINFYNKFELPKKWGSGESVSVDGTYWDMYQQNLLAEHHIRYGEYGGLGYYHISDDYIALFGNFIPCGVYEAVYIFDGVNENESEIQPTKIHGDTGAQSEVVFGFAVLLGIQLMPRIRNFKHLRYYKPYKNSSFKHINDLFSDQVSDWEFIENHY